MAYIGSHSGRRLTLRQALEISGPVLALALGWPFAIVPARAACTFDAGYGGFVCSGTSPGFSNPGLNNSKVQLQGGARIEAPGNSGVGISLGSENTVDNGGSIKGGAIDISSSGNLIVNNTGQLSGPTAIAVTGGNLELNNTSAVNGRVHVFNHVKLTNSGSLSNGVHATTAEIRNSGEIKDSGSATRAAIYAWHSVNITNDGVISGGQFTPAIAVSNIVALVGTGAVSGDTSNFKQWED